MVGRLRTLSGASLKWIAIAAMTAGHIAQSTLPSACAEAGAPFPDALSAFLVASSRIAFPLFCFLCVEGCSHTHDLRRYAARLLAFAVVSEVPFDLAVFGRPVDFSHQNVMFELALCVCAVSFADWVRGKVGDDVGGWCAVGLTMLVFAFAADAARLDYGACGIVTAFAFHVFREDSRLRACGCVFPALMNPWALCAVPFILLYDGSRGRQPKWFFYVYYPTHLLVLWVISVALLTQDMSQYII